MSAHLPQLHAPRWLRDRPHEGRAHRAGHPTGRGHAARILPVALVAALSLGSWLAQVGDVAAGGATLGVRMLAGSSADRQLSARAPGLAEDAREVEEGFGDMPSASVDAITL